MEVHGLLLAEASLVVELGLWGPQAQQLWFPGSGAQALAQASVVLVLGLSCFEA